MMFKKIYLVSVLILSLLCYNATAQQATHYDLADLLKNNQIEFRQAQHTQPLANTLPGAITTVGNIWFKNIRFSEGVIDIDLRGKNVFLNSFLGIVFHGVDTSKTYDVLYFRPFNFRYPDTARRRWSVAYMSLPDHNYAVLRNAHPLVYENSVSPIPEPHEWFHATITVAGNKLSVYVNRSNKASLVVTLLNDRRNGLFGLFSDGLTNDFANLTITEVK